MAFGSDRLGDHLANRYCQFLQEVDAYKWTVKSLDDSRSTAIDMDLCPCFINFRKLHTEIIRARFSLVSFVLAKRMCGAFQ